MLVVAAAGQLGELARVPRLGGALGVAAGDRDRHDVVGVAVDDELRERRAAAARSGRRGRSARASSSGSRRRAIPLRSGRGQARGLAQVEHAGLRHRSRQPDARLGARGSRRGSPRRAAAQNARWPPAECPIASTRARSSDSSRRPSMSMPAATSSKVAGQPPRLRQPRRRYSRFQAAQPRPARSATRSSSSRRS